ncbi:hypothetical protein ACS0TY_009350 [Phlomoides rotata]
MFEKSVLYVPRGIENRNLRAKVYPVLCLCYLGHLQLDRSEEYINEAEKLEPNIASSFLKVWLTISKCSHILELNKKDHLLFIIMLEWGSQKELH